MIGSIKGRITVETIKCKKINKIIFKHSPAYYLLPLKSQKFAMANTLRFLLFFKFRTIKITDGNSIHFAHPDQELREYFCFDRWTDRANFQIGRLQ